jgi:hypothetical protein
MCTEENITAPPMRIVFVSCVRLCVKGTTSWRGRRAPSLNEYSNDLLCTLCELLHVIVMVIIIQRNFWLQRINNIVTVNSNYLVSDKRMNLWTGKVMAIMASACKAWGKLLSGWTVVEPNLQSGTTWMHVRSTVTSVKLHDEKCGVLLHQVFNSERLKKILFY